jgi:nicotinamide riboside kinase
MSVGKTTLAKELAKLERFKDYQICTERSQYLKSLGIKLNTDSTLKGQFIFGAERASELMHENLITDRSVYDVCAFTISSKSIDWTVKRQFCESLLELRSEYDVIIYISPKDMPIEDNGVRETNEKYRDQIDYVIVNMLDEYKPKWLIKVEGSTEQRIDTILANLP